jgi:hypothetical protein
MGRAKHDGVGLAGKLDVAEIAPLPAQQPRILEARYRLADPKLLHALSFHSRSTAKPSLGIDNMHPPPMWAR